MSPLDTLPPPEAIADQIESARRERSLLRRLYRLSVEAREIREITQQVSPHLTADERQGGEHE